MTCKEVIENLNELDLSIVNEDDILPLIHQYGKGGGIITQYHPAYGKNGVPNFFVRAQKRTNNIYGQA